MRFIIDHNRLFVIQYVIEIVGDITEFYCIFDFHTYIQLDSFPGKQFI